MPQIVNVALYDRDNFSRGNSRKVFGFEAFHWGIIISPEKSTGHDCSLFEATNANTIDPTTFRMIWTGSSTRKPNVDPVLCRKLLRQVVIGRIPDEMPASEIHQLFCGVPMPVKNTHPQQSCVTWTEDAIRALQLRGWATRFNLAQFKDYALGFADERIKGQESKLPPVVQYDV